MGNIELFNKMAAGYDSPERLEVATVIAGAIRTKLVAGRHKSAIDYGCGTGLVGLQLLDDFKEILFIDGSAKMVEEVSRKIEQLKVPYHKTSVLCANLETENPNNLKADYILVVQTLLHIKEYKPLLASLYKILNQDGRLIVVDFDKNEAVSHDLVHNGFEQAQLSHQLKEIGFSAVNSRTFYEGDKLFMKQSASLFIMEAVK